MTSIGLATETWFFFQHVFKSSNVFFKSRLPPARFRLLPMGQKSILRSQSSFSVDSEDLNASKKILKHFSFWNVILPDNLWPSFSDTLSPRSDSIFLMVAFSNIYIYSILSYFSFELCSASITLREKKVLFILNFFLPLIWHKNLLTLSVRSKCPLKYTLKNSLGKKKS